MEAPVQVPPVPRYFMQPVVGREWVPDAVPRAAGGAGRPDRKGRRKAPPNPCLVQLTTFAVTRLRMRLWGMFS
jgi:hypothetical protein